MTGEELSLLTGEVLEEEVELTLAELCSTCRVPAEWIFELVEEGILEPRGTASASWRFSGVSLHRVRCVQHLESDLGVNVAGAALALELIEQLEGLRMRLQRLDDKGGK
jgi:chaperone modulatory protein CbpM